MSMFKIIMIPSFCLSIPVLFFGLYVAATIVLIVINTNVEPTKEDKVPFLLPTTTITVPVKPVVNKNAAHNNPNRKKNWLDCSEDLAKKFPTRTKTLGINHCYIVDQ